MGEIIKEVTSYIAACYSTTIRPGDVESDVLYRVWGAKMVRKGVCIQPELQYLPPFSMAFEENVKRAHLQATIWQTALNTDPLDVGSNDYVWLKFAPSVILKITQCLCATDQPYSSMRCSCTSWMFNFL